MGLFSPVELTRNCVPWGVAKARSPIPVQFLLAVLAGMIIALASAATNTASYAVDNYSIAKLICGLLFPFGLGMVILTGADLFTGDSLMVIAALEKEISLFDVLKKFVVVYCGNFVGALMVSLGCIYSGQFNAGGGQLGAYTIKLAVNKMSLGGGAAFVMGIFCNVLVCMGVLMAMSGKDTTGKILGAYLPVAFFVICGFEHCVANMYYLTAGLMAGGVSEYAQKALEMGVNVDAMSFAAMVKNLIFVTLGNIVGGMGLGGLMHYCFIKGASVPVGAK